MGEILSGLVLGIALGFLLAATAVENLQEDYIKDCQQFGKVRINETVLECSEVSTSPEVD